MVNNPQLIEIRNNIKSLCTIRREFKGILKKERSISVFRKTTESSLNVTDNLLTHYIDLLKTYFAMFPGSCGA